MVWEAFCWETLQLRMLIQFQSGRPSRPTSKSLCVFVAFLQLEGGCWGHPACNRMQLVLAQVVSVEIPHANLDPADIAHRVQTKAGAVLKPSAPVQPTLPEGSRVDQEAAGLALQHSWPKILKNLCRTGSCLLCQLDYHTIQLISD